MFVMSNTAKLLQMKKRSQNECSVRTLKIYNLKVDKDG